MQFFNMLLANEAAEPNGTLGWVLAALNGLFLFATGAYAWWQGMKGKRSEEAKKHTEFIAAQAKEAAEEERRAKDFEYTRYQRSLKLMEDQVNRIRRERLEDEAKLRDLEKDYLKKTEEAARLDERNKDLEASLSRARVRIADLEKRLESPP